MPTKKHASLLHLTRACGFALLATVAALVLLGGLATTANAQGTFQLGEIEDTSPTTSSPSRACQPGVACKPGDPVLPSELDFAVATPGRPSWVTPVKDQGGCGSCVVFSVTAALESHVLRQKRGERDLSEQFGISCLLPSTVCGTGTQIRTYIDALQNLGTPSEVSEYPYQGVPVSCDAMGKSLGPDTFPYQIIAFEKIAIASIADLKSALFEYGPVVAAFEAFPSIFSYKSGVYRPSSVESKAGGHATLVVGYSEKLKAFRVKNSWGQKWGEGGYFWMAYDQVTGMSSFATRGGGVYAVTDAAIPESPFYQGTADYPPTYNFGEPPAWPAITGDFDGNGTTDYARLGGTYSHLFLSKGDGTFQSLVQLYPPSWDFKNPSTWIAITGDFDGDGKTDYARLGGTYAHVFLSKGDGSFQNLVQYYPPGWDFNNPSPWEAITGDFNGDGRTDYLRLGAENSDVFLSKGDGAFEPVVYNYPENMIFADSSAWVTISGDFNRDGKSDYARLGGKYSHIFTSKGDGSFSVHTQEYPSGWDFSKPSPWAAITGDFNGDGRTDYLRLGAENSDVFLSIGDGSFEPVVQNYPNWNFGNPSSWLTIAGDFDRDGKTDYARLGDKYSAIFLSKGDGSFQTALQRYPWGWEFRNPPKWPVITGDFNHDGKTDYARLGRTRVYLSTAR